MQKTKTLAIPKNNFEAYLLEKNAHSVENVMVLDLLCILQIELLR